MPHTGTSARTPTKANPASGGVRTCASITIREALDGAPILAQLATRIADSSKRLDVIRPLVPSALRTDVRAGPFDDTGWCIFAPHNAAAAKLRQLKPAFRVALEQAHLPVTNIKIKVQSPAK